MTQRWFVQKGSAIHVYEKEFTISRESFANPVPLELAADPNDDTIVIDMKPPNTCLSYFMAVLFAGD